MPTNLLLHLSTEAMIMPAADPRRQPPAEGGLMTPSLRQLLQITTLLWVLYFAMLIVLDQIFVSRRTGTGGLPNSYYIGHIAIATSVLALIRWHRMQRRLGAAFLPLVIGAMSVGPIMLDSLILPNPLVGPIIAQEGLISLRLLPSICVGLVLVAWYYRWRHVVGYVLGTAGLTIVTNLDRHGLGNMIGALVLQSITLLLFGYCISVLTDRLNLQRSELMEANRQLQGYASTQERLTISRERNRVARELHDTLAHTLSGLTVQLETIKAYWTVDPATARTMLNTALGTARTGLHETRRALGALRVSPLDDLGLGLAVKTMAESAAAAANLRLQIHLPEIMPQLGPEVEQGVYRIAQEAIANATIHAQATTLSLDLKIAPKAITLLVRDDGVGFDPRQTAQPGHYGIAGMRERALLLGAQLSLDSTPGAGTRIEVNIPRIPGGGL
ncbi:MAG: sensor histidine kinase [Herpetosiphonaceae bacterium]|nr:sensor histidine kinase [Herpetosiphonaceae bacterium]